MPTVHHTAAWKRTRSAVLKRDGRRCVICDSPADAVHHVVMAELRADLELEMSNLISVCAACHKLAGTRAYERAAHEGREVAMKFLADAHERSLADESLTPSVRTEAKQQHSPVLRDVSPLAHVERVSAGEPYARCCAWSLFSGNAPLNVENACPRCPARIAA